MLAITELAEWQVIQTMRWADLVKLVFRYKLTSPSMAEAYFADSQGDVRLEIWNITPDPLGDLLRALLTVLRGTGEGRCNWETDPGQSRLLFHRREDMVSITILGFEVTFSTAADQAGAILFRTEYPLIRFANKVRNELRRLLGEWGSAGYERYWGQSFPYAQFDQLDHFLREQPASPHDLG